MNYKSIVFREFTQDSLQRIENYRQEEAEHIASERLKRQTVYEDDINDISHLNKLSKDQSIESNRVPNKELAVGQTLPLVLQHRFPSELIGKPIEEIDSYYRTQYMFVVVNRNNTIFRFSATRACFIFSPFNCFRRLAIHILTHSLFSTVVMLTILTNCIFMTLRNAPEATEYVFTIIYTLEALIKCVARGFILQKHTFLRDPWNWLDFIVITLAYITFFINLGKVAVLRTFRVLRALKTVAVVPGLKTIVNALIQSFIALRDVAVLSSFILSIFALVGLQLYMGVLRQKCVPTYESFLNSSKFSNIGFNMSYKSYLKQLDNETYWYQQDDLYVLCGNASGSIQCPDGYVCWKDRGISPDFGYTSFDNYGWAMLACFRLMTQDYWENLYQLVLSAAGRYHFFYFVAVIFFGSFYLINLILAIVSMSYLDQQKKVEAENEELERRKIEDELEIQNEEAQKALEIQTQLHIDNASGCDNLDRQLSYYAVSIEYEQNRNKNELNNLRSSQTAPSIYQVIKSNLSLSNTIISKDDSILFIDDTGQNSPNENRKSQQKINYSHTSEQNQNHNDSIVTTIVALFVLDAFVDLFITICIVLNTLFMALDRPGQSETMTRILTTGNYIFTSIFTAESILKIIAMTPGKFLRNGWNVFDLIIVTVSLIELALANMKGLSVLRSFRLLRIFKLAKSWQTLNRLISIIGKSIGALGNLTLILIIIIFIFAVMGMQLFGQKYYDKFGKDIPRWNFFDFFHAFMIVFRVLCGEWIESMWVCLECAGWPCIPFFLLTFVIGNLVILNLFLALLLASFGSNVLIEKEDEENKIAEAIDRIQRFVDFLVAFILRLLHRNKQIPNDVSIANNINDIGTNNQLLSATKESTNNLNLLTLCQLGESNTSIPLNNEPLITHDIIEMQPMNNNSISPPAWQILHMPPDCFPNIISKHFLCCAECIPKRIQERWTYLRSLAHYLVEHQYFECLIILSILASSTTLALEDIHTRQQPTFSYVLTIFDKIFTVIFTIELILKWFAYGITNYFKNGWNKLDFVIVVVSVLGTILDLFGVADIPAFKSMRTLRALRPLKALSRFEGIRVVVNALFGAIPSIFNVLLVCLVFWLIFSIMGVQLFGGKFYKCVYVGTHDRVNISDNIKNKIDCLNKNFTWENSRINFDNVLSGYLALFQVATFKGWTEIMADATDAKDIDVQPEYETNVYILLYFVLFIIFGSFFTLNLFIGVVIDNFNQQKRMLRADGSIDMFMTEDQKKYYNAMKKMGGKKPTKALPRPRFALARFLFDLTTSQKFDIFIMICIFLNMVCMCLEHHNQSHTYDLVLGYINHFFVAIFTIECLMKLIALNFKYFTIPWNVFDFVIVIASILGQALGEIIAQFFVNPTLLRVVRVARVGRILRLVKAKGIRTLLFALAVSMPALFNIGLLLFLVMFIYSIFGMSFFAYVRKSAGITDLFNFETFPNSMIVLFQMCTTAGWSGVFQALTNDHPPDCDPTLKTPSHKGDCGDTAIATPFLVSYVIITSLVVVNMYIAVILENFNQAQEDVQQGLTDDDYDMYYEKWQNFDPSCSQYIQYDQLSDFVDGLEPPLCVPKPNHLILIGMNLPICENDRMHCVDILDGLTKYFLGTLDTQVASSETDAPIDIKKDRPKDYHPITTTIQRQREFHLSRLGLKHFRNNVERRRNERKHQELTLEKNYN
ncbi:unnamed protein product [Rotaria sp. Silwood2]|nr:unnamed protein product [Rotaria sp. Silwood2]CAF2784418.1 unnamed protein product [Rotaria sp. Silwood2]CAF3991964.1 unnamed protein product [Rotaria sp. Silwood2]CAF4036015.1 unnamed protein product [Rotaria sp. Silwood2]